MSSSQEAIALLKQFATNKLSAAEFADRFPVIWRQLRDKGALTDESPYIQRALDVAFSTLDDWDESPEDLEHEAERDLLLKIRAILSVIDGI